MHLHLIPLGGLSGDMFCAALIDAFPELLPRVRSAVASLAMPRPVEISAPRADEPLRGTRFQVTPSRRDPASGHHHTPFRDIRGLLETSGLEPAVRRRALSVFELLASAEARVHGTEPDAVTFHEIGAWDSIADIVSAAALLDALGVETLSCAPLPIGSGRIQSAHGVLPVPAPATTLLLAGFELVDDGIGGERVTPTGAAILSSVQFRATIPAGARLQASGRGYGTRRLPGLANCLEVLVLEPRHAASGLSRDRVAQLRFEVDDQSPEDLAVGLDRLRSTPGVLSVTTLTGVGKKGRATMAIEVLSTLEASPGVAQICFRETSTIGLRIQEVERLILSREHARVDVHGRSLGVKVVQRPGGTTAKVESDDLAATADASRRDRLRGDAQAMALGRQATGTSEDDDG